MQAASHRVRMFELRSNVQRHQAEGVSGVVNISDAYQFDNGVVGAYRRFDLVRRNEVFVTVEAKVGYTEAHTAQCGDCCILCRLDSRCRCHRCSLVGNSAAGARSARRASAEINCVPN